MCRQETADSPGMSTCWQAELIPALVEALAERKIDVASIQETWLEFSFPDVFLHSREFGNGRSHSRDSRGMRYTMSDWWKKKSTNNVLYTRVVVNLLSTVMTMKNTETTQAK